MSIAAPSVCLSDAISAVRPDGSGGLCEAKGDVAMRIEWTSADQTEAVVTRGFWRWRRYAEVHLVVVQVETPISCQRDVWRYCNSGKDVEWNLDAALRQAAKLEAARLQRESDWLPVVRITRNSTGRMERPGKLRLMP